MAAYIPIDKIEVEIWGKRVGAVVLDPNSGYYVFAYYPNFLKLGIELAPVMMPLSFEPYVFPFLPERTYRHLPALLADALPDDFGNSLVDAWMAQKGVSKESITALDRLGYMGKRSMGALEFKPSRTKVTSSRTAIDLSKLVDVARQSVSGDFQTDAMAEAALNQIIQVGTSAGGARAKAAIAWNPDTNEIRAGQFDVAPGFQHWLLKFDGVGADLALGSSQDYGRIEMAYHLMATTAGITMSPCRLIEENGRAHFITKRFDRDVNKKIHMSTLCAMGHLDYKQKGTHDYAQYFMVISKLELGYRAMEEAFRRMAFNVMAANCDDHTKNHSFIMPESGQWQLAPAYDVTHAYSPASEWTHQHLMSVNGKFKGITREDLLAVANRFGIGTAKKVIREVGEAVSNWMEFAGETGVDHNEASKIKGHHIIM
ncbi:MAG: type II toxin-antitoxin system HipA family toxin [Desulfuromonadaceae bacterium]|nr:type II toxin-antitoxin system HipA family toxin [Desulfuromonadaceae bacterium]MDD2847920.1 type II toxin-antitoxin system HipA family toxin [Desulfuromonadaceae bacterium]MDD4131338.1 type II toxin-antitoxin system HipA family toxin [Desulfuromonadaceae bacterium]